jgi:molecular chaperone IbpA
MFISKQGTWPELKDFDKFFVGFEDHIKRIQQAHDGIAKNIPNYPPYNIKKIAENKYAIEIAVAGFAKSDIELELDGDKLHIRGKSSEDETHVTENYLYKGIAARPFTRTFMLNDNVEVKAAAFWNGMLKVVLEHIIPEHNKPRKIEISDEPSTVSEFAQHNQNPVQPQLLTEHN